MEKKEEKKSVKSFSQDFYRGRGPRGAEPKGDDGEEEEEEEDNKEE